MRILIIFCLIIFCSDTGFGQSVFTKDGENVGDRKDFINSCTKGAKETTLKIKGVIFDTYKYCSCVVDNLIPTLYSYEIANALDNDDLMGLFLKDDNFKIISKCADGNFEVDDDFTFDQYADKELSKEICVKECVISMMSDPDSEGVFTKEFAEDYCECAVSKLLSSGLTYKDILEIEDEDSEAFNEIAIPCLNELLADQPELDNTNTYIPSDIMGTSYSSRVSLIDYFGQGYKIKISIDGVSKYYLFDTGASRLVIDNDIERELLLNGTLKRADYLEIAYFELANNEEVKAQLVRLNNVKIGDYIVNNVVAAIFDGGSLLCGKGFLDKFRKWEIDKEKEVLILYR